MKETVEDRGWAANGYECRDGLVRVAPAEAPHKTDPPFIPDYVMRDFGRLEQEPVKALYKGGPRVDGGETTTWNGAKRTERTFGEGSWRPLGRTCWLISKNTFGWMEVLTLGLDGRETLPVFSHEEEAEMFLGFGDAGDGWRVRKSSAGEVISVLYGPCAGAKKVALDPLPEMVVEKTVGLVSLLRERFIERVEDGERFFRSRKLARRY